MKATRESSFFFFFNDTATTEIYTLSLHDALPISIGSATPTRRPRATPGRWIPRRLTRPSRPRRDRKSTRLNSSHSQISYAVFCLKKKTQGRLARRRQPTPCRCHSSEVRQQSSLTL